MVGDTNQKSTRVHRMSDSESVADKNGLHKLKLSIVNTDSCAEAELRLVEIRRSKRNLRTDKSAMSTLNLGVDKTEMQKFDPGVHKNIIPQLKSDAHKT